MGAVLLDTSVILDHLKGRFRQTEQLDQLVAQRHLMACCAVHIIEVYAGLRPGEEEKTEAFVDSLEFFPVTAVIAPANRGAMNTARGAHPPTPTRCGFRLILYRTRLTLAEIAADRLYSDLLPGEEL